mgnify:CR=1 FL=1
MEEDAERDAERAESLRDAERVADAQEREEEEIPTLKSAERAADAQEADAERAVPALVLAPADAVN